MLNNKIGREKQRDRELQTDRQTFKEKGEDKDADRLRNIKI